MSIFSIFCREMSGTGTTWIGMIEGENYKAAAIVGRANCANEWGYAERDVRVVGVAHVVDGAIHIPEWDDENGIDIPAPLELTEIRIEIDAYRGCDFTGSKVINIYKETFEDGKAFHEAMHPAFEEVDKFEINDDPHGLINDQIQAACYSMLNQWNDGDKLSMVGLTVCGGRAELDEYGEPMMEDTSNSPVLAETFDVSIWIKPILEEQAEDE